MIAITSEKGALLRALPDLEKTTFGFHPLFGFISEEAANARLAHRKLHGLDTRRQWLCRFRVQRESSHWTVQAVEGCEAVPLEETRWQLRTSLGNYYVTDKAFVDTVRVPTTTEEKETVWKIVLAVTAVIAFIPFLLPKNVAIVSAPEQIEPVTVKVVQEKIKAPPIASVPIALPRIKASQIDAGQKGAIAQNLGFLNVLGQKDLKNALGGTPSQLKNASPGAGIGGSGGSGGELLAGLGAGVKRTTVGNTGVAGNGGVGGKAGPGGGAGGYGNALIGSGTGAGMGYGNGRSLSAMPLSQDIILEGGLNKSVISATIAKYLNQVRACYEDALRGNPGLMGQVTMDFEINGTGKLNFAKAGKSSLGNAQVPECIAGRMLLWEFPKPLGGVNVKVSFPFVLRPANS